MLETDRQPQEVLRGARAGALDRRPMLDETLRAAEARRSREDAELRGDLHRARLIPPHLDRHHPAEGRHLAARNVMCGVRGESRVMDHLDARMAVQERGALTGVLAVFAHRALKRTA